MIANDQASGFYHVGDEGKITLQEFLDQACQQWGSAPPWRMPLPLIYSAAKLCEGYARITGATSPLTGDFIDIGCVSYYGDTARFRELVPTLRYRTVYDGLATL